MSRPDPALPENRRSPHALDLRRFTPAAITNLAQKISATASAEYRPRFGVGVTDWRIMALLGAEPWLAPVQIAEATGLDKAAVAARCKACVMRDLSSRPARAAPAQPVRAHARRPRSA